MGSVLLGICYLRGLKRNPDLKVSWIEPHPDRRLGSLEAVFNTVSGSRVGAILENRDENVTYHIRVDGEIRAK